MPGGYTSPFANPCGQQPSSGKCFDYRHSNAKYSKVTASVNNTTTAGTGASSENYLTPREAVSGCSGVGLLSFCGNTDTNDASYPCGAWPAFLGAAGSYRPYNRFTGGGTIDLSGPCRQVGRQQAQFQRWWHGMFGFETCSDVITGETCASVTARRANPALQPVRGTTKYCAVSVVATATQDFTINSLRTYTDGSTLSHSSSFTGAEIYSISTAVNPISGLITCAGVSNSNTLLMTDSTGANMPGYTGIGDQYLPHSIWNNWGASTCVISPVDPTNYPSDYSNVTIGAQSECLSWWDALLTNGDTTNGKPLWWTIGDVYVDVPQAAVSGQITISDSGLHLTSTCTPNAPADYTDPGDNSVTHYTVSGSFTIDLLVTLSAPNTVSDVLGDIAGLEALWDYANTAKHPFRTDPYLTIAPLYCRNERQVGCSPKVFPETLPYYDPDSYFTPAGASNQVLIYDGAVIDAMAPEGTASGTITDATMQGHGIFDFAANSYYTNDGGASCSQFQNGISTPGFLPQNCRKWTDGLQATGLFPCEFVAIGTPNYYAGTGNPIQYFQDEITIQRWREIQIHVPSENPCRPFGADRLVMNWPAVDGCDGDGNPTIGGNPISALWPNCPGQVFSEAPGVGGRVRVVANVSGTIQVDVPQPYFCTTPTSETVNVYNAVMTLLGTATATRVDATHFAGFSSYPTAAWITPVYRNDGTTAWHYYDCNDFPKGHYVAETHVYDLEAGAEAGTGTATVECVVFNEECGPTVLTASASPPPHCNLVSLAFVRQWDISKFWMQQKVCSGSDLGGLVPVDPSNCSTLPQFIESEATTLAGLPMPPGQSGCGAIADTATPWSYFASCPSLFDL